MIAPTAGPNDVGDNVLQLNQRRDQEEFTVDVTQETTYSYVLYLFPEQSTYASVP